MYQQFYGLQALPFELAPNPRYLLLTPTHREALSALDYGIRAQKGVTLLVGEAGTGKTTLLRKALTWKLHAGPGRIECVYINHPTLTTDEFYARLAADFALGLPAGTTKAVIVRSLEAALARRRAEGHKVALIVDEAQALPDDVLEELRLLTNLAEDDAKLLPLVLAGQPELAARLDTPRWRPFKQRIVLRCELKRLDLQETGTYIFCRIKLAGGVGTGLFTRDAVLAIDAIAKGVPRVISLVCDNALLAGFALQRRPVDADIVREVSADLVLGESDARAPVASMVRPGPHQATDDEARGGDPVGRWPRSVS